VSPIACSQHLSRAAVALRKSCLLLLFALLAVLGYARNASAQAGAHDSSFNPSDVGSGDGANSIVNALVLQPDGKVLIGGFFTSYNDTPRNRITRLNSDGTLDASFNQGNGLGANFPDVRALALQPDGRVLIGGDFSSYNGVPRSCIARLNSDGSLDEGFNPGTGANSLVYSLAVQPDGRVLIGGEFFSYNGTPRSHIARVNSDGSLDTGFYSWTGADSTIWSLVLQPDGKVLIGGAFTSYNGTPRNRIARVNSDGSLDTGFNPGTGANSTIRSLALQPDGKVFIGGAFTSYNGTSRNGIARLNADGSLDTSFNPGTGADDAVISLTVQPDGKVLIGGAFTSYNGTLRNRIARLNTDGSLDTSFNPGTGADGWLNSFTVQPDGKILIGGEFTIYNGTPRNRIARLSGDGGLDSSFNAVTGSNNDIEAIIVQPDGRLLIGGAFTGYNDTPRNCIARLNNDGILDTSFNPNVGISSLTSDLHVTSLALQLDGKILIGGAFASYNGTPRNCIARVNSDGSLDTGFNPGTGANSTIWSLALQPDGRVLIGGWFTSYNGTPRKCIARLNPDGSLDTSFNPGTGADGGVESLTVQPDGKILIGGTFTSYNGTSRNRIARLNTDGSLDTSFNPGTGANGGVESLTVQPDGKILIGGHFIGYDGMARNRIARLNSNGSLDMSFSPGSGANSRILTLALQPNGKILIGGQFTSYNGTPRSHIARVNSDGSLDTSFLPGNGPNYRILTLTLQTDGKVLIGGEFTRYGSTPRNRIARVIGDDCTVDTDGDGASNCVDSCPNDPLKVTPGVCGCGIADSDSDGDGTANCLDGCPNDPLKVGPGACGCGLADTDTDGDGFEDCYDYCPNDPLKFTPGSCGCGNPDTDTDNDGAPDCNDGCPNDPLKVNPGFCGCGVADTDADSDGTPDCNDLCPNDPLKIAPGVCGCGVADTDSDNDSTPDCNDGCPNDPLKTAPGVCGCGVADTDSDNDGTPNCVDFCPNDPLKISPGLCGCGTPETDTDGDTIPDCVDNCPSVANTSQTDCDADQLGDACEIAAGASDCNANTVPDACELASGSATDFNQNGVLDACEAVGLNYCFGDGTNGVLCPCSSLGLPERGCNNSAGTGGAVLRAYGSLSSDTVVLVSTGELPTSLTIFLQGSASFPMPASFGDGLRCVGGSLKRLYVKSASGGMAVAPMGGDLSVRAQSAALGDVIAPGTKRYYQAYYRDANASFCPAPAGSTYNITNGVEILWP